MSPRPSTRARRRAAVVATLALGGSLLAVTQRDVGTAAAAGAFGNPVVVTAGISEPGVHAAPDGTLYVEGPPGVLYGVPGSPSPLYVSRDGGATWRPDGDGLRSDFPGGGDTTLAIAPGNSAKLFMADLWLGSSTVARSTNTGKTWVAQPVGGSLVQDRQWLAATATSVYLSYHQVPSGITVARSVDGGVTYPVSVLAASAVDQTLCVCPPGNLVAESHGLTSDRLAFAYATTTGGVRVASSRNGGLTWKNVTAGDGGQSVGESFPVLADVGGGHLVLVWTLSTGGTNVVRIARSSDMGQTWGAPQTLIGSGSSVYPWVAARGAKVVVSVYHTTTFGDPNGNGGPWYEDVLTSTDGGLTFGAPTSIDPVPAKTSPICTGGLGCGGNRELGDFQSVAIDRSGLACVTWVRLGGGGTRVMFARG